MTSRFPHAHLALALVLAGCATAGPDIRVRGGTTSQVPPAQAAVEQAQMLQARGEHALAIETYRKIVRFDPGNASAYAGLASCYDRIGRPDLADRYYQLALARDPRNPGLAASYANTLARQGRDGDAARLLSDLARAQAPSAEGDAPAVIVRAAPSVQAVTARAVMSSTQAPTNTEGRGVGTSAHMRLERLSLAEVALVTRQLPAGRTGTVRVVLDDPIDLATVRVPDVRIINAVGRRGQAARMRAHLERDGWQRMTIGDSAQRPQQSRLVVPAGLMREGHALASRLPFRVPVVRSGRQSTIVLVLGADAVRFDERLKARTS